MRDWNGDEPEAVSSCFHDLFSKVAQQYADAPAICSWDGDGDYTYDELEQISSNLAHHLNSQLGVDTPETSIAICFPKCSAALIAMLSVFKAGGAFVALDSTYPVERLKVILDSADASLILVHPADKHVFQDLLPETRIVSVDKVYLDNLPAAPETPYLTGNPVRPSDLAYLHFTSGSTGSPKGIMIEHRQLCTAVNALATPMNMNSTSRVLQFAAYIFDLSFGDIFVTWSQGGCICIPSDHERVNDLAGAIKRMNVNNACLVPSVARILKPENVPGLQTLLLGGEALLQENLITWAGRVTLRAMYGPSECTIWCTSQTNLSIDSRANNIGRGYGARLWIADSSNHDMLLPIGGVGELLIEGPVVARGYLNSEQTRKSFIKNPQWARTESRKVRRFYKTGDLAKFNEDGSVSFIGRKDTQIKLHGRRIEIGDIEHHLSSHELVRQSVVILPSTGVYVKKLVAVVVLDTEEHNKSRNNEIELAPSKKHTTEIETIRGYMALKLPGYMVPQVWLVVQRIPLLISDKMDRVRVKKFVESILTATPHTSTENLSQKADQAQASQEQTQILASTEEVQIRAHKMWKEALSIEDAETLPKDKEFASLGDSFSAMNLVAKCRSEGLVLSVDEVLGNRTLTINEMARRLWQVQLAVTKNAKVIEKLRIRPLWWTA
ncbi:hypothetical protein CKM354_000005800 [Cercospora kikuchii]|uniref:Carrier domain-containing protein n=1 Tax=Cercospora kikuchii TaxID=84275 RepID=A0A9P3F7F6_9PEZI|nr:uncharacterized protein CKM354_000005800 [Cercospora kikuchii]GIZ36588.1 hypothetical protein CKM354_000005800 [Cercospora kikuchii]